MEEVPLKAPNRPQLIAALHRAFDAFMRIVATPAVPAPVRLDCWREANAIMAALFRSQPQPPTDGRSRRR